MGSIDSKSDGSPWRPIVHIEDISRAFIAALEAPKERVFNEALNVGCTEQNYRIRDIIRDGEWTVVATSEKISMTPGRGTGLCPDHRGKRNIYKKAQQTVTTLT